MTDTIIKRELLMFKLVLEKAEEPEIKLPTSAGSWKKQESSRKTSISALLTMPKPLTVWTTTNSRKREASYVTGKGMESQRAEVTPDMWS